jgi:hypothetical protein
VVAACLPLLMACAPLVPQTVALRSGWPTGVPGQVELTQVPFFAQEEFQCGPAALATLLTHGGMDVLPDALVEQVWLPARGGSLQIEMLTAARRHGFVAYPLALGFADLLREVASGHPVLVLQDVGLLTTAWHYAVVVGFDYPSGTIYLRSGTQPRLAMPFTAFERSWMKGGYWAFVALPPHQLAATAEEARWTDAVLATGLAAPRQDLARAWAATLARWPNNLPAAVGLGNELHGRGELQEAAGVLEAALARHPDDPVLVNNLAHTLSDPGPHPAALQLLARAGDKPGPHREDVAATRSLVQQRLAQAAGAATAPAQRAAEPGTPLLRQRARASRAPG